MSNELKVYQEKVFEEIKHIDEFGNEYWEARELMVALEYKSWRYFEAVITKAMLSCKINNDVNYHFVVSNKTISMPKSASKEIIDYKLSRYACYLIVQNGNPRNKQIALGQTYFAVQTRKMEITEEQFKNLSEDEKRLYTRASVRNKNKFLFNTAKDAGVKNYGKFNNYGYRGLYNGETAQDIAKRKGISDNEDILDYMGSTELAANLFRITQTDEVLKNKNINNELEACNTHHDVGKAVRDTIEKVGGTLPEDVPTPNKSIKEIEVNELNKLI